LRKEVRSGRSDGVSDVFKEFDSPALENPLLLCDLARGLAAQDFGSSYRAKVGRLEFASI
jgi:hypothetical protein